MPAIRSSLARSAHVIALCGVAIACSASSALAGAPIPTPLAGFLGLPGWAALGAGYGAFVLARRLRNKD